MSNDDLISREALKRAIDDAYEEYDGYDPHDLSRFAERVIEFIDNAPTVSPCYQTTSCLDCKMYDKENHNCPRFCEVIREMVKEAEKRPTGEWEKSDFTYEIDAFALGEGVRLQVYTCSNPYCCMSVTRRSAYCPHCGAKMKGEEE